MLAICSVFSFIYFKWQTKSIFCLPFDFGRVMSIASKAFMPFTMLKIDVIYFPAFVAIQVFATRFCQINRQNARRAFHPWLCFCVRKFSAWSWHNELCRRAFFTRRICTKPPMDLSATRS